MAWPQIDFRDIKYSCGRMPDPAGGRGAGLRGEKPAQTNQKHRKQEKGKYFLSVVL